MTPSCCTIFRLLAHVSLLKYSRSSNVLALRRTLANISAGYPCIGFSWTQGVKNINRPNYSQELKGFWHGQVLIIQITLGNFFSSWGIL